LEQLATGRFQADRVLWKRMTVTSFEKLAFMMQQSTQLLRRPARAALQTGLDYSGLGSRLFWRVQAPVNGVAVISRRPSSSSTTE